MCFTGVRVFLILGHTEPHGAAPQRALVLCSVIFYSVPPAGGWRNGYTLEVRATTQLRIRTSTCSRSCAAQWGSVAFGGGRGLGRGGGAKGEERGCGGRQAYREPIDFYVVFLTAFGQSVSRWWSTDRTERPHIGHCSRGCSLCFANDFLRAPPSPPALQCGQCSVCGACSTVCSAVCHQSRRTRV